MFAARTRLRRLVASLMLAVLAVVAVAGSAHAGRHALGVSHGVGGHAEGRALPGETSAFGEEAPDAGESSCCSCCQVVAAGLAPSASHGLIPPAGDATRPRLADLPLPSSAREGPRRPPRLP